MPYPELTLLLTEFLEEILISRTNANSELEVRLEKVQQDYQYLLDKEHSLRKMYESEIDQLKIDQVKTVGRVGTQMTVLQEDLALTKSLLSRFDGLRISEQEPALLELHRLIEDGNHQIWQLKEDRDSLQEKFRRLESDNSQLKIQLSVALTNQEELQNLLHAAKKDNEELIQLQQKSLRDKTDTTNPVLLNLAECLGVVPRSDRLEFEMMDFGKQVQ